MSEAEPALRRAGILLHPTSLPGPGGGDLGPEAQRFVDWLADAGQSLWQVLPLVATGEGGSPYDALSAFAGNPLLLSPRALVDDGLLEEDEAIPPEGLSGQGMDFVEAGRWKDRLLRRAHGAFRAGWAPSLRRAFAAYRRENAGWLDDWALFRALRDEHGAASWTEWGARLARRDPEALGE